MSSVGRKMRTHLLSKRRLVALQSRSGCLELREPRQQRLRSSVSEVDTHFGLTSGLRANFRLPQVHITSKLLMPIQTGGQHKSAASNVRPTHWVLRL